MCHIVMEFAIKNGVDGWEKTFTLCRDFRSFECDLRRIDVVVSFTPDGLRREPSNEDLGVACKMLLDLVIIKAQEVQGGNTGS
ncbi:hypothetical protein N7489_005384 [Penicillium chrysogenum]|jgi:hypothetical protein|uniref:uncharacterized protein n=1 Tax=Penicillium chrysogenum TaxID=5076 RepID=UPI0024DF29EB|nr:uncharacterized protein N7489_005384 [Penicillium chrysogenum]KAJ5245288.1 hypothetical protein N7489_005384 [Penicillium chrysogenum]KAJ6156338.1 hypothetical protein N7497_005223 [Penicillium chrysogenum]